MNFKQKYFKYKNKYLNLKKKLLGGSNEAQIDGMLNQGPFDYTLTTYSQDQIENVDSSDYIKIIDNLNLISFVHKDDECKLIKEIEEKYRDLQIISIPTNEYYKAFQLVYKKNLVLILNYKNPKTINYLYKDHHEDFIHLISYKYDYKDHDNSDFFKTLELIEQKNLVLFKIQSQNKTELALVEHLEKKIKSFEENKYIVSVLEQNKTERESKYHSVYEVIEKKNIVLFKFEDGQTKIAIHSNLQKTIDYLKENGYNVYELENELKKEEEKELEYHSIYQVLEQPGSAVKPPSLPFRL